MERPTDTDRWRGLRYPFCLLEILAYFLLHLFTTLLTTELKKWKKKLRKTLTAQGSRGESMKSDRRNKMNVCFAPSAINSHCFWSKGSGNCSPAFPSLSHRIDYLSFILKSDCFDSKGGKCYRKHGRKRQNYSAHLPSCFSTSIKTKA